MSERIRIFCGCPANNEDLECQMVFEYSLRKFHPQDDLDIVWMQLSRDPSSFWYSDPQAKPKKGWNTHTWATPFTPFRFGIPAFCGYEGKAIYNDCDQIWMADVAELWNQPIPEGKALLMSRKGASCVMLLDNARMKNALPPIERLKTESGFFRHVRGNVSRHAAAYSGDWNCLDGRDPEGNPYPTIYNEEVKLLHYTMIPTQPNHKWARARLENEGKPHWYQGADQLHASKEVPELFDRMMNEALEAGYTTEQYRVDPEFGDYGRHIK